MSKVMEARLATWSAVPPKTCHGADPLERIFKRADIYSLPIPHKKERGVSRLCPDAGITPNRIFRKELSRLGANRDEAALEELRIANSEYRVRQINVGDRQREGLRSAQRSTVHQAKKGTNHQWI